MKKFINFYEDGEDFGYFLSDSPIEKVENAYGGGCSHYDRSRETVATVEVSEDTDMEALKSFTYNFGDVKESSGNIKFVERWTNFEGEECSKEHIFKIEEFKY